jgi:hypothetical protein
MMCGASAPDTQVQFLRLLVKPVNSDVLGRAWAESPGPGLGLSGPGPMKISSPAQTSGLGLGQAGPGLRPGPEV